MNEQETKLVAELLAKYARTELSAIGEYSGSIERDARVLKEEVETVAKALSIPIPEIDWSPYILT